MWWPLPAGEVLLLGAACPQAQKHCSSFELGLDCECLVERDLGFSNENRDSRGARNLTPLFPSRALNVGNPSKAPRASAWTSGCYWEALGTYKIWGLWEWLRSLETCSQNARIPVFVVSAAPQFLL